MATTHQNDLRTLDQTRQRLLQLTNALSSLQREIEMGGSLPNWTTLTTSFSLISHQLASLTTHLSNSAPVLSSLHAYPLPIPSANQAANQPATPIWHTQENILTQLLRKKLDPDTERWIDSATNPQHDHNADNNDSNGLSNGHALKEGAGKANQMSTWAADKAREIAGNMPWGSAFTIEEMAGEGGMKSVKTGLKRDLVADEDEDDDDDDDDDDEEGDDNDGEEEDGQEASKDEGKMDVDLQAEPVQVPKVPMMVLEDVLRFAMTGGIVRRSAALGGGSGMAR